MMEYEVSIRLEFPTHVTDVLRKEKERFTSEYGSSYKSEPHITLYLDSYLEDGFTLLIHDLQELHLKPFSITLLGAKANVELNRHRNLYIVDLSNKDQLTQLHNEIQKIAERYHSPFLREKTRRQLEQQGIITNGKRENLPTNKKIMQTFDPHITLGAVDLDAQQPNLVEVQNNTKSLQGAEIVVSSFSATLYGKQNSEEKFQMIERVVVPFQK